MHPRFIRAALGCAAAALLALAPAAMAGTIRYDIAESPAYSIDNEQGIVKVTYNGCVVAGERQTISFAMVTNASNDATVGFKVLKEEGEDPVSAFDPATVALTKGAVQTFDVVYSFTLNAPTDQRTTFRFKLDPENGAGLGEGPGVMVHIPCVLAAPTPTGGFATVQQADGTVTPVPTSGVLGTVQSGVAAGNAPCIATPRSVRLRAGERTRLDVVISTNGQRIQNALVRVTLPGGRQIKIRTGLNGVSRFTLRPKRGGRAVIQSDVCFGARRVTVLAARVQAQRAPARFTG